MNCRARSSRARNVCVSPSNQDKRRPYTPAHTTLVAPHLACFAGFNYSNANVSGTRQTSFTGGGRRNTATQPIVVNLARTTTRHGNKSDTNPRSASDRGECACCCGHASARALHDKSQSGRLPAAAAAVAAAAATSKHSSR